MYKGENCPDGFKSLIQIMCDCWSQFAFSITEFYHYEYHPKVKSLRYSYFLLHEEEMCLGRFCFFFL